MFLQDGKYFSIGVQGKAAKGTVRICDIACSLENCIACLLWMFRLISLLKRFYKNGAEFCDVFGMASLTPTKLAEGKINETRRSMAVDSARYKVTVWLCPPGNLFKQTHSPEKKKRSMAKTNRPGCSWRIWKNVGITSWRIMQSVAMIKTMIEIRIRCTMLKTVSFLLRRKGRRKKKITQKEERERRLRDMPTRYVWKFVGLSRRQLEPSLRRVDCVSWLHHRPCYTGILCWW